MVATRVFEDEALEFAESIINTVREPLMSLDQDLRVVSVSRSFCSVFKVEPEETVGHLIYDLGNRQWDIPKLRELLETILPEQTSFDDYEVEHEFADIGKRTMLLNARQIHRVSGKERIILLAIEDITERRQIEAGLEEVRHELQRRTVDLTAVNAELEAFAHSVSHDLRAPLRAIDGFSRALLEDYHDKLDAEGQSYLNRSAAAARRMGELIDDLLGLSRITRTDIVPETVDLSAIGREVVAELRQETPEREVEVLVAPGLLACGDAGMLRQALRNLLGNAWKYTAKAPVARIELGGMMRDGEAVVFVRDNGVGFDMAYSERIFEPFQRLHTVTEFPGSGIGLSTVQRIIRRHGGRVWAEAKVNVGATVFFSLPPGGMEP
jgi:PAS domain S-box-containing protein